MRGRRLRNVSLARQGTSGWALVPRGSWRGSQFPLLLPLVSGAPLPLHPHQQVWWGGGCTSTGAPLAPLRVSGGRPPRRQLAAPAASGPASPLNLARRRIVHCPRHARSSSGPAQRHRRHHVSSCTYVRPRGVPRPPGGRPRRRGSPWWRHCGPRWGGGAGLASLCWQQLPLLAGRCCMVRDGRHALTAAAGRRALHAHPPTSPAHPPTHPPRPPTHPRTTHVAPQLLRPPSQAALRTRRQAHQWMVTTA